MCISDGRVNKKWSVNTKEYYSAAEVSEIQKHAAARMKLRNGTLRPRSQTRKLCIVRFHVYDVSRQQADQWLPGAGEREEEGGRGSHCLMGVRSPSGSWKPHLVLELGRADGCTTV